MNQLAEEGYRFHHPAEEGIPWSAAGKRQSAFGTSSRSTFLHTSRTRWQDPLSNRRIIFHPSIDPKDRLYPMVMGKYRSKEDTFRP